MNLYFEIKFRNSMYDNISDPYAQQIIYNFSDIVLSRSKYASFLLHDYV